MLPYAEKLDFNLLLPEFRGCNLDTNENGTKACGSLFVMQDIKDAIDFVVENENVDAENIFLPGASGGGHRIDMEQAVYWILSQYNKIEKTTVTG